MNSSPTIRLYLKDDHCFETKAIVSNVQERCIALDQTCFHPGGGGQPPDSGILKVSDEYSLEVESVFADENQVIWHICKTQTGADLIGKIVYAILNRERRLSLMRYHTVLHIFNTIVLRDYGGWITGVQIGTDYSRIDFKLENFTSSLSQELEEKVNLVILENHPLKSFYVSEEEFRSRADLLRTLVAKPPIDDGQVRVVEIESFDAQACGGTHLHTTGEVGRFSIFRMDNKGKNNKRFYVKLDSE